MNRKKAVLIAIGGATVVGVLLFAMGGEASAETSAPPPPEPDEDDDDDAAPIVAPLPEGELPTTDLLDDLVDRSDGIVEQPPMDRVTIDPIEVVPPTPLEDGDLLDRVRKELPKVVPFPTPIRPAPAPAPAKPPPAARPTPAPSPYPVPPRVTPSPEPVPDIPDLPMPDDVDDLTAAMVVELLEAEQSPKWKFEADSVRNWQKMRGLKVDGQFGPLSARMVAQETGLLPIVRYWPKAAVNPDRAIADYRAELEALAADAESPRREHLIAAAARERGQGFGTPPKPITPTIVFS